MLYFLAAAAQQLFAKPDADMVDMPWSDLFGLDPEDTVQLQALIKNRRRSGRKFRFTWTEPTAGASGSKWMSRTIPATHAVRFSFFMMSLKFMTCAACSTSGRSFTISWAGVKPCSLSTSRSATWRGLIRRC